MKSLNNHSLLVDIERYRTDASREWPSLNALHKALAGTSVQEQEWIGLTVYCGLTSQQQVKIQKSQLEAVVVALLNNPTVDGIKIGATR